MVKKKNPLMVRIVAVAYIVLILLGNIWLVYAVVGQEPPPWFQHLAAYGVLFVLLSVLGLGIASFLRREGLDGGEKDD
jgi:CDP-diglyceride synthetase